MGNSKAVSPASTAPFLFASVKRNALVAPLAFVAEPTICPALFRSKALLVVPPSVPRSMTEYAAKSWRPSNASTAHAAERAEARPGAGGPRAELRDSSRTDFPSGLNEAYSGYPLRGRLLTRGAEADFRPVASSL